MNLVALTGVLTEDPQLHEDGTEPVRCRMRLTVPRHARGEVAQLVEHTTENRGVAGSIPALAIL